MINIKNKNYILIVLTIFVVSLSGCTIPGITDTKVSTAESSLYLSSDLGDSWQKSSFLYSLNGNKKFDDASILDVAVDPQDEKAIYLGTEQYGLLYTFDGGTGWHQTLMGIGKVSAVDVDSKNTCTIYATILNRVYKTTDCARHWTYQLIKAKTRPNDQITTIRLDSSKTDVIYAGSSGGSLFVSQDAGLTWSVLNYFNDPVTKILVKSSDSNILYVATQKQGLFKSRDNGETWVPLFTSDITSGFPSIKEYRSLSLNSSVVDGLVYVSKNYLFISEDGGDTWRNINLLTPPKSTNLVSATISSVDKNLIYVAVQGILYVTFDGGQTWATKKINSSRSPAHLLVIGQRGKVLLLGMKGVLK